MKPVASHYLVPVREIEKLYETDDALLREAINGLYELTHPVALEDWEE